MRMLVKASFPHEPFNTLVRNGTVGDKMKHILEDLKPEAVYFTEFGGRRTAILILNLTSPSQIPTIAEPFFLTFNADLELHPIMSPEDLAKAHLDSLGKKWA